MKTGKWFWHGAVLVTLAALIYFKVHAHPGADRQQFPRRPITVVVPFAAGGGSDLFARIMQKAVSDNDLLTEPLVILNQGGGSGTIGSRTVKHAKPDGYTILCLHDALITAKLSGKVNYGPEAFEPIAATGDITLVVVVHAESPYMGLADLLGKAKAQPRQIRLGTNLGAPAHFAALQLERGFPGAQFRFVQSGGGQKRYALLIGKHVEVGVFSLAEYMAYRSDGRIRALSVLTPERSSALPDVPTAREQGVDLVSGNMQYWWAPKGTPKERVAVIASALEKAMQTPFVKNKLEDLWINSVFLKGADLQAMIGKQTEKLATVKVRPSVDLPDFPALVMVIVAVLVIVVLIQTWRDSRNRAADMSDTSIAVQAEGDSPPRWLTALACFMLLCAYVAVLGQGWGYVPATAVAVFLIGGAMARGQRRQSLVLAEIACVIALGTQAVCQYVFALVLP